MTGRAPSGALHSDDAGHDFLHRGLAVPHHRIMTEEPGSDSRHHGDIEQITFRKGDILFEENEVSFHFFIIEDGEVEVFKKTSEGKELILAKVGPGSSLGEFAMLDRQSRSASARALTDLTAAKVSPEAYARLLTELPEWAVSVMRALVERLRVTNNIVRELQKSKSGLLNVAEQQALESAEFSDSDSRVSRIRAAEGDVEQPDIAFDFSIYDSAVAGKRSPGSSEPVETTPAIPSRSQKS